jgi:hypothetical protein
MTGLQAELEAAFRKLPIAPPDDGRIPSLRAYVFVESGALSFKDKTTDDMISVKPLSVFTCFFLRQALCLARRRRGRTGAERRIN